MKEVRREPISDTGGIGGDDMRYDFRSQTNLIETEMSRLIGDCFLGLIPILDEKLNNSPANALRPPIRGIHVGRQYIQANLNVLMHGC
jgi:hypothetical protein